MLVSSSIRYHHEEEDSQFQQPLDTVKTIYRSEIKYVIPTSSFKLMYLLHTICIGIKSTRLRPEALTNYWKDSSGLVIPTWTLNLNSDQRDFGYNNWSTVCQGVLWLGKVSVNRMRVLTYVGTLLNKVFQLRKEFWGESSSFKPTIKRRRV